MGMDLSGVGGNEYFSNVSWYKILKLAYEYGWQPQGTEVGGWYDENGELNRQLSPLILKSGTAPTSATTSSG